MNKREVKKLLLDFVIASLTLLVGLLLFILNPEILLSLWLTGIIILYFKKRQNPDLATSKKFQLISRLLYFQVITISFAFFFIPSSLSLLTPFIPIVVFLLTLNKKRRSDETFIKWTKYVGFHVFNMVLLLTLLSFFPEIGGEEAFFNLILITLINSIYAVVYLKIEPKIQPQKKLFSLLMMLFIITSMTMSWFPQQDGNLFQQLFGGR